MIPSTITNIPYLGEVLSLITALTWAFAVILFKKSGEKVHPITLTLFKALLASVLLLPTSWLLGGTLILQVPPGDYWLLLLSGALGLGISDTLFFMSLNKLGASLAAIVDCFYSLSIIGLSIIWLNERLTVLQVIGAILIISALLVATQKNGRGGAIGRHDLLLGVFYGILSMLIVAVSIVMIKPLLERSSLIWASEIRLIGGVMVLLLILLFLPTRRRIISSIFSLKSWGYTLWGSFIGGYLSQILWLAGMKFTQASVAAALNQTSSIFIFIFAALLLKEPINKQRIFGIILAVLGTFLVVLG
ncbi:MAG: DMT family transporter [Candidatus Humimicrobiia bacterium]